MFVYGKTAANAVAIMSYLAANPNGLTGSHEIARVRKISPALTAKLLTQLAAAGLVKGLPGPGGGYALKKAAKNIALFEIVSIFEQTDLPTLCPYGEGYCGNNDPCPLHFRIQDIVEASQSFLRETRLSVFLPDSERDAEPKKHLTALQKKFSK
jgi:Rrf2 family iron-sulfur cluster assembly transcriptional regulator